jgi:hypothetical protein
MRTILCHPKHVQADPPPLFQILHPLLQTPLVPPRSSPTDQVKIEFGTHGLPVRKACTRSKAILSGYFNSVKNNRTVAWESLREKTIFESLEAMPFVTSFLEQPAKLHFSINGIDHWHIPDVLVILNQRVHVFIEVKRPEDRINPAILARTRYLEVELQKQGYFYIAVVPEQLKCICQANIEELLFRAERRVPLFVKEHIRNAILNFTHPTIEVVLNGLAQHAVKPAHVYRLILEGTILFNWHEKLTMHSPIFWRN